METPFEPGSDGPSIVDVLVRRWKLVVVAAALGGLLGIVIAQQRAVSYEANASIIIRVPGADTLFGTLAADRTEPERYVNDQSAILGSTQVATGAITILDESNPGHGFEVDDLVRNADIVVGTRSDVIRIRFRSDDENRAIGAVNALVQSFEEISGGRGGSFADALSELEDSIAATTDEITAIQTQIDAVLADPGPASDAALDLLLDRRSQAVRRESELFSRRAQLTIDANLGRSSAALISPAVAATTVGTSPLLALIAGLILGGTLGTALAYWSVPFRRRLTDRTEPEAVLGVQLLGSIPVMVGSLPVTALQPSEASDALWSLSRLLGPARPAAAPATADEPAATDPRGADKVVAFVSADDDDEARSLVAANVAAAVAQAGDRVLLVSAHSGPDRLVDVLTRDGVELGERGLIEVLRGDADPHELVQSDRVAGVPLMDVLVCGGGNGSPRHLFGSSRFGELLDQLAGDYAFVVLDAPAVLREPYAGDVLREAGRSIAVVADQSPVRSLQDLAERLDLAGLALDGYVFTAAENQAVDRRLSYQPTAQDPAAADEVEPTRA